MGFFKSLLSENNQCIISNGNMHKVTINGKTIKVSGNNVSISNGKIIVDGKEINDIDGINSNTIINVIIEGNVGSVQCNGSVEVTGNVGKNIDCGGSVTIGGTLEGSIDCGGSVTVQGDVTGDIDCGGSVRINGSHKGDIDAGGSVSVR